MSVLLINLDLELDRLLIPRKPCIGIPGLSARIYDLGEFNLIRRPG